MAGGGMGGGLGQVMQMAQKAPSNPLAQGGETAPPNRLQGAGEAMAAAGQSMNQKITPPGMVMPQGMQQQMPQSQNPELLAIMQQMMAARQQRQPQRAMLGNPDMLRHLRGR